MTTRIEIYRHQDSIKDAHGNKVPTPEGIAKSYATGLKALQEFSSADMADFQGYHSSSTGTIKAIKAYLLGVGFGKAAYLSSGVLDEFVVPDEIRTLRKELGDSKSCEVRFNRHFGAVDPKESYEVREYYETLKICSVGVAKIVRDEVKNAVENRIEEGNDLVVVAYGHEPTISLSLLELVKPKGNPAESFLEIAGTEGCFFPGGDGYQVTVRQDMRSGTVLEAHLETAAGSRELDVEDLVR
ncbi:MAG: hypothetical protein KAT77_05340 [Nanoarchaeota archaeon]|nr:hypothetical protein [Nanoarchaeota archaeon]